MPSFNTERLRYFGSACKRRANSSGIVVGVDGGAGAIGDGVAYGKNGPRIGGSKRIDP